jgi:hypothetical protein
MFGAIGHLPRPWRRGAIVALVGLGLSSAESAKGTWNAPASSATPYSPYALVLLNTVKPSMAQSLYLTGGSTLSADAGIQVNSSATSPMFGGNAVCADTNGHCSSPINVVGGWGQDSCGLLTGTINTGVTAVSDPLASVATPGVPGQNSSPCYPGCGSWTMQPGLYTSDPNVRGGSAVTMSPGLYYFQGCGFTVSDGASVTGTGVTIYIDNGGGALNFQSGTSVTLAAATSTTAVNQAVPGIVYFQARNSTAQVAFAEGINISMNGTFYAPRAQIVFNGDSSQFASQVVCDSMKLSNSSQITILYSSSSVAGNCGSAD